MRFVPTRLWQTFLWLPGEANLENTLGRPVMMRNGRSIYVDGTADVVFAIEGDREELSRRIVNHFAAPDWEHFGAPIWRPRYTHYLNPQQPTSFVTGWRVYGGGGRPEPADVDPAVANEPYRRWHVEWEDERGNLITYDLGGQGPRLRGMAVYVPKAVVDEVRSKIHRP
jgi:hypothetical protein